MKLFNLIKYIGNYWHHLSLQKKNKKWHKSLEFWRGSFNKIFDSISGI